MRILSVGLPEAITCAVHRTDPTTIALVNIPGWSFINPLHFLPDLFAEPHTNKLLCQWRDTWYLFAQTLHFLVPDSYQQSNPETIPSLLRLVRYTSKQASLILKHAIEMANDFDSLPTLEFPEANFPKAQIRDYVVNTPVTMKAVKEAGALPPDFEIPVYDTLLLDGMRLLHQGDNRSAILYAAIAMEAMASTRLDEAYNNLLAQQPSPRHLRISDVLVNASNTQRLDPVYRALSQSDKFGAKLNELPLYLNQRSLRIDNQSLYDRAVSVYKTRNSVVHSGATDRDTLPLTHDGAVEALECAVQVFRWFGVPGCYAVPTGAWVEVS